MSESRQAYLAKFTSRNNLGDGADRTILPDWRLDPCPEDVLMTPEQVRDGLNKMSQFLDKFDAYLNAVESEARKEREDNNKNLADVSEEERFAKVMRMYRELNKAGEKKDNNNNNDENSTGRLSPGD